MKKTPRKLGLHSQTLRVLANIDLVHAIEEPTLPCELAMFLAEPWRSEITLHFGGSVLALDPDHWFVNERGFFMPTLF